MNEEEKLKAIIGKAVKGGYEWDKHHSPGQAGQEGFATYAILSDDYPKLIFSHDFAKAFWGLGPQFAMASFETDGTEDEHGFRYNGGIDNSKDQLFLAWQYQLQQLALTPPEERIDYLFKFL